MDDDVEGELDDGDEMFDELMDGTRIRSSDVFKTSWEAISSSVLLQSCNNMGVMLIVVDISSFSTRSSRSSMDWSCLESSFGTEVNKVSQDEAERCDTSLTLSYLCVGSKNVSVDDVIIPSLLFEFSHVFGNLALYVVSFKAIALLKLEFVSQPIFGDSEKVE